MEIGKSLTITVTRKELIGWVANALDDLGNDSGDAENFDYADHLRAAGSYVLVDFDNDGNIVILPDGVISHQDSEEGFGPAAVPVSDWDDVDDLEDDPIDVTDPYYEYDYGNEREPYEDLCDNDNLDDEDCRSCDDRDYNDGWSTEELEQRDEDDSQDDLDDYIFDRWGSEDKKDRDVATVSDVIQWNDGYNEGYEGGLKAAAEHDDYATDLKTNHPTPDWKEGYQAWKDGYDAGAADTREARDSVADEDRHVADEDNSCHSCDNCRCGKGQ